ARDLGDALPRDLHREALGPQTPALAGLARTLGEEALVVIARGVRRRLPIAAHEVGDHALESHPPAAVALAALLAPLHADALAAEAVEHLLALPGGQLAPRPVEVDLARLGHRLDDAERPALSAIHRGGPRRDRPAADRLALVGHDELRI